MTGLPLNINIQQIFLHMMNFLILFGGLYFLLFKPVKAFMEKRTEYFASLEKQAEEKMENAQKMEAEYKERFQKAEKEVEAMKAAAAREAEKLAEITRQDAEEQSRKILAEAHANAARERERLVNEAREDIIELAIEAERKLLHEGEKHEQV